MLNAFSQQHIPSSLFWLGPVQSAEETTGLAWNGNKWIVYYREHGSMFDVMEFDAEEDANDELYRRVTEFNRMLYR